MNASLIAAAIICLAAISAIAFPPLKNRLPRSGAGELNLEQAATRMRGWEGRPPSAEALKERVRIAAEESRRWGAPVAASQPNLPVMFQQALSAATIVSGTSWVSLGPTDARFEFNGVVYTQVDSGRASGIQADPRDANVVYLATAGGGVWKTWDFIDGALIPSWPPITEMLGN